MASLPRGAIHVPRAGLAKGSAGVVAAGCGCMGDPAVILSLRTDGADAEASDRV